MGTETITADLTIKLPAKHALDWLDRCGGDLGAEVQSRTARTAALTLPPRALEDLIADAAYYAVEMGPDNTEDIDYRPPARTCLRALDKAGVDIGAAGWRAIQ